MKNYGRDFLESRPLRCRTFDLRQLTGFLLSLFAVHAPFFLCSVIRIASKGNLSNIIYPMETYNLIHLFSKLFILSYKFYKFFNCRWLDFLA